MDDGWPLLAFLAVAAVCLGTLGACWSFGMSVERAARIRERPTRGSRRRRRG